MNVSKSTSGKSEGFYEAMPPAQTRLIDSHLFQNDDGTVYYCWQADYIAKINSDMTALTEEPFILNSEKTPSRWDLF